MVRRSAINRRDFLKRTSVAAGIGALGVPVRSAAAAQRGVALIIDPRDPVAASETLGLHPLPLGHRNMGVKFISRVEARAHDQNGNLANIVRK
jgi:hypothetical protein